MSHKNSSFSASVGYALRGIGAAFVYEANLRRQFVLFLLVILLGVWFQISRIEWLFIILMSTGVFVSELGNSAIEALSDAVHPERSSMIELCKDMSAGAVLVMSFCALVIGFIIFLPYIRAL